MIARIKKVKSDLERIQFMADVAAPTDYEAIKIKNEMMKKLAVAIESVVEVERYLGEMEEDSEPPLCLPLKNGEMSFLKRSEAEG